MSITKHRAVTPGTQQLWFVPRDLFAKVVHKRLPVHRVVTVQTSYIDAMGQVNLGVFRQFLAGCARDRFAAVAFVAVVRE